MKHNKGFIPLIFLVIAGIVAVGAGAVYVYEENTSKTPVEEGNTAVSTESNNTSSSTLETEVASGETASNTPVTEEPKKSESLFSKVFGGTNPEPQTMVAPTPSPTQPVVPVATTQIGSSSSSVAVVLTPSPSPTPTSSPTPAPNPTPTPTPTPTPSPSPTPVPVPQPVPPPPPSPVVATSTPPPAPPPPPPDTAPPHVQFDWQNGNITTLGIIFSVSTYDTNSNGNPSGVAGVKYLIDGVQVGNEDTSYPYVSDRYPTDIYPSGSAHTLTAVARDVAGNTASTDITIYAYGARMFVSPFAIPSTILTPGEKTIMKFTVGANGPPSGPIAWRKLILNVSNSSNVTLTNYQILQGGAPMENVSLTRSGDSLIITSSVDQVVLEGSKSYEIKATIAGNIQTGDYVATSFGLSGLPYSPGVAAAAVPSSATIVWSDLSAGSHSASSPDWFSDFPISNNPVFSPHEQKMIAE